MSGGGYPIPGPGELPHPRSRGVPHPRSGVVPQTHVQQVPHLRSGGVPRVYHPSSRPGWGTLPPSQTLDGVLPLPRPEMGYPPPPLPRPEMGYPPPPLPRPEMGYPPPSRCGLTHKVKILPSPILRMRAVKIATNIKESFLFRFPSV